MAKQIKIGHDQKPAPVTKQFIQLIDIDGTPLFDDAGNPLVTEENAALTTLTLSENALSVHVNNNPELGDSGGKAIPVVERFKETSEVSSSLLGIPRSEEQLSLFSDVATYGLDVENWDASQIFKDHRNYPEQWYRKEHPIHGRRSNARFYEGSDEQALYLKAFPSQYTYPEGTKEQRRSTPSTNFIKYMNFIALGRYLYNKFLVIDAQFAKENFISETDATIVQGGVAEESIRDFEFNINDATLIFANSSSWFDVKYGQVDLQDSFDAIERWTSFYDKIAAGTDQYPQMPQDLIDAEAGAEQIALVGYKGFAEYGLIRAFVTSTDTRPGGLSNVTYYGILQSKRSFRYQPGRASGFTFGARMVAGDPNSTAQIAEWGCSNDTDEYMFQLKGSEFNIVRRSTVRMPNELLERQGLDSTAQKSTKVTQYGIGNNSRLWETVISRSDFNGDNLLGNGPSGYILSFEDVTMYKVEFSWYGAIGAKFYAYIPVENDEARWVLLHTFVIENGLGEPILENPDFKFKYLIYTNDTKDIREPMYLYKYGSSVYIDGGDEGTIRLSSKSTTGSRPFTDRTPILGILPKEELSNTVGESKPNYKKSYPNVISVTSDRNCRIDFEEIKGTPMGVHFNYSPCIHMNGRHPKTRTVIAKYDVGTAGNTLNRITLLQPNERNQILLNGQNKFDLVTESFLVDLQDGSSLVNIASNSVAKTFDTLQVGDCLYFGEDLTNYKIKKFINQLPLQSVQVTGTSGEFSCQSRKMRVGERFSVTGTLAGSATATIAEHTTASSTLEVSEIQGNPGITESDSVTSFKLVELNGNDLTTTAGTVDGLTFTTIDVTEYSSENKTTVVLEENYVHDSNFVPSLTGAQANLRYVYNQDELYSHVLADGVFGTYVGADGDIFKRRNDGNEEDDYKLQIGVAEDSRKADGSIFRVDGSNTDESKYFEAKLIGYHTVVASTRPIYADKFRIHFLNPTGTNKDSYSNFSEFSVGITPYYPLASGAGGRTDDEPQVKFDAGDSSYIDYDRNTFPSIEYCHLATAFDSRDRIKLGEIDYSYGPRLSVDPRLDGAGGGVENKLEGADPGIISAVKGEVATVNFPFETIGDDPDPNIKRIIFAEGEQGPEDNSIIPGVSEIGIDFAGSGHKYQSQTIYPPDNAADTRPYIQVDASAFDVLNGLITSLNKVIQTKMLVLTDDWQAVSLDENGDEIFQNKSFRVTKAVPFDAQPLYPVFALSDNCRINGVVIEEISEQNIIKTHTPTFVTDSTTWNTSISFPVQPGTSNTNNPSAFNGERDLSACRYDESLMNPLRPGNVLYSYYVAENETVSINLDNIFARDRKGIERGSLNNKAIYITASKLTSTDPTGNVQISLTSREQ
jgi:hypothetical protein